MYFTDRGIEELEKRRGDEEVTLAWLADNLQAFVDTPSTSTTHAPHWLVSQPTCVPVRPR